MKTKFILTNLLLANFLTFADLLIAENVPSIPADQVSIQTPKYVPEKDLAYQLGTYTYDVSWSGISAAEADFAVDKIGNEYQLSAVAKTLRPVSFFYRLLYSAKGILNAVTFQPIETSIDHRENSRIKLTKMKFLPDGKIEAHRENQTKGKESTEDLNFNPENFTIDPFSAAFLARSIKWEKGKEAKFDTFNGKSRYLIKYIADKRDVLKVNGVDRNVWVVKPYVDKLTQPGSKKKLREAWIYVTDDAAREVLLIKSEVFIGTVKTQLIGFKPKVETQNNSPLVFAKINNEDPYKVDIRG